MKRSTRAELNNKAAAYVASLTKEEKEEMKIKDALNRAQGASSKDTSK